MEEKLIREPLYEKLKKKLLSTIETENLHMLPNERELMARFGVSRNTLRRAIFELTKENILRPVQGIGTIVYPVPEIVENSRILIVCDREMSVFQQEVFNLLLFHLNNSRLNTIVLMLDKENVDVDRFDTLLKTCDGVVIDQLCSYSPIILERIRKTGKKMVCLRWRPDFPGVPFVAENVNAGFHRLARHLIELGHTRIAYVGNILDQRRMIGLEKAFQESGLELLPELTFHLENGYREEGYQAADSLLKSGRRFTAVIAHNDACALGVEERLLIAGLRIPEEVSITGFDNLRESACYPVPLTTCCGDPERMIHEAIAYLFSTRNSGMMLEKMFEPRLIVRQSTARVPRQ